MSLKSSIARGLRWSGLLGVADDILAQAEQVRGFRARRQFARQHPDFVLPPTTLAYDAFGQWNPDVYRRQGRAHAAYIAGLIRQFHRRPHTVGEWGCGPMRVLRHMRDEFPDSRVIGLDYNPHTIVWCKEHFRDIEFHTNALSPPLPLPDGAMDAIYAISVFTHLSEPMHRAYARDLYRCLAPGGLLVVTLHGDAFHAKLTAGERAAYDRGDLVVRDGVTEGKRGFVAFHPPAYVNGLFSDFSALLHDTAQPVEGFMQDTWVFRRDDGAA